MNTQCSCGGKFHRTQDTDTQVAHWVCEGCGAKRTRRRRSPMVAAEPGQILIVGTDWVIGPFPDAETAQDWIDAPHTLSSTWVMLRLGTAVALGNAETAHHCGTVLETRIESKVDLTEIIEKLDEGLRALDPHIGSGPITDATHKVRKARDLLSELTS